MFRVAVLFALMASADARRVPRRLKTIENTQEGEVPLGHIKLTKNVQFPSNERPDTTLGEVLQTRKLTEKERKLVSKERKRRELRGSNGGGKSGKSGDDGGVFVSFTTEDDDIVTTLLNGKYTYIIAGLDDDTNYAPLCDKDFEFDNFGNAEESLFKIPSESAGDITTCNGQIDASISAPLNEETGCGELYMAIQTDNAYPTISCDALSRPKATLMQCIDFDGNDDDFLGDPGDKAAGNGCILDVNRDGDFPEIELQLKNTDDATIAGSYIVKIECCPILPAFEVPDLGGSNGKTGKSRRN